VKKTPSMKNQKKKWWTLERNEMREGGEPSEKVERVKTDMLQGGEKVWSSLG